MESVYMKYHKASGLKVGDKVKVLFAVTSRANSWNNGWSPGMTAMLGKTFTINADEGSYGFSLLCYSFPAFCLEKVEEVPEEMVTIDGKELSLSTVKKAIQAYTKW